VLRVEASRQGRDHERTTLLDISASIRRKNGLTGLAQLALEQWYAEADAYNGLAVDGPRAVGDAEGLHQVGGRLFFVDAPIELRYKWMLDRSRDEEAKLKVIGTFVEVLGLLFGCKDTIQPAVFGVPRSCLDVVRA